MAAPAAGPCDAWATIAQMDACDDLDATDAQKTTALNVASDLLWRWSGYRYPGVCSIEGLRPCAQGHCAGESGWYGWGEWSWWPSWGFCGCQSASHRDCGCDRLSEIRLGRAPIVAITQVKVDGAVLVNGTDYHVTDYEWLTRLPRTESWPSCQRLDLPDTQPDTFSVSFDWGRMPTAAGVQAAVDLASELVKTCLSGDCAPPENASTINRQGTGITFVSAAQFGLDSFDNLRFGVKSVDRFLSSVPHGRPAVIVSPESRSDTRRVAT